MATTYKTHTDANGSKLEFDYPFPVLKTEDVKVALNGGVQAATKYTVSLAPAKITFNNTSLNNTLQESTGAPKNGVEVRVFRNTEVDNPKGVFAAGSSIRSTDLNNNVDQALYALQEEKNQPLWNVAFEGGTIDGVTIGGTTPAAGTFSNLTISNLDSTIIGSNTAAAGTFTTLNASTLNTATLNVTTGQTSLGTEADDYVSINGKIATDITPNSTWPGSQKWLGTTGHPWSIKAGSIDAQGYISTGGNLSVDSNTYKLRLGDAQELEVYHNGTHSYIDNNKGNLYIRNNVDDDDSGDIFIQPKSGENGISIYDDEGVILYYNGSERLRVYNTNIQIDKPLVSDSSGSDADRTLGTSSNKWKEIFTEALTATGNVDLGNAATDSITPTGRFDAHIIPLTDGNIDLGASGVEFNDLYIDGTAYIDEISLDNNQKIKLGSSGDTEIYDTGTAFNIDADGTIVLDTHTGAFSVAAQGTTKLGWSSTVGGFVNDDWLPFANDTHSLGADSFKWKNLKLTGTAYLPTVDIDAGNIDGTTIGATTPAQGSFSRLTLNQNPSRICSDTSDGSDNNSIIISGGGDVTTARGSTIASYGNEHTQAGNLDLYSGATSTGKITLSAGPSTTLGLTVTKDGDVEIPNDLSVTGTLTVNGTTTTLNTSTLEVEDKNITLAKVSTPTDVTADGGGITIKGATDKTFNWVNATDAFTSSEHIHLAADDKKLLLGAASTDAEIYYNGNTLVLDTEGQLLVESVGSQNYKIGSVIRLALYEPTSQILANWPIVPGTDDTYDLGSSSHKWKDIYIDGTAYLDRVAIGTTTEGYSAGDDLTIESTSHTGITLRSPTDKEGAIYFSDGTSGDSEYKGIVMYSHTADALKLYSDTELALTLDSSQNATFAGDIKLSGSTINNITNATADGSDNQVLIVGGGGAGLGTRGAIAAFYGNEVSSNPGNLYLYGGGVSTSKILLHTGTSGTLGLIVDENQKVGIGTATPTNALDVQGGSSNTAIVARSTDAKAQISLVDNSTTGVGSVVIGAEGDALFLTSGSGGTTALTLDSSQNATFAGTVAFGGAGSYVGSNVVRFSPSGAAYIDHDTVGQSVIFRTSASSALDTTALTIASDGGATFPGNIYTGGNVNLTADNKKIRFGAGEDLQIWHGESNSGNNENANYISCASGRNLVVQVQDDANGIVFHKRTGTGLFNFEALASFTAGGSNSLYYDGTKKFETASNGVQATGSVIVSGGHVYVQDGYELKMGGGEDLKIKHSGAHGYIDNNTGSLIIRTNVNADVGGDIFIKPHDNEDGISVIHDSKVELCFDGSPKFETLTDGVRVHGYIYANDSNRLCLGDSADLQLFHASGHSEIDNNTGNLSLKTQGNLQFFVGDSEDGLYIKQNDAVELYFDGQLQCKTNSNGMHWLDGKRAYFGSSSELQIYHSGTHAFIKNTSGVLHIQGDNSSDLKISPNDGEDSIILKNGAEVALYHANSLRFKTNASGAEILGAEGGDANLFFYADEGDDAADKWLMQAESDGFFALKNYKDSAWEMSLKATGANNVELYYDNSKKLHTFSGGVKFFGTLEADDNDKIKLGDNADLEIYHDGTNNNLKSTNGHVNLYLPTGKAFSVGNSDFSKDIFRATEGAGVTLYWDGSAMLSTFASGISSNGYASIGNGTWAYVTGDNSKSAWGDSQELQIYHGSDNNSYINESGSGNLYIKSENLRIQNADGSDSYIEANNDGAVELYWGGTSAGKKFETTSAGITVTGAVTETSDIALKTNIKPIDNVLDKIKQITGYTYQFKDTGHDSIGVTAQDVEKVFPELVHGEEGAKTLQYSGLIGALIESVKELSAKVKALEAG